MRLFFMFMIFAIGFSGFSTASHAFIEDECNPASMAKTVDKPIDLSDCNGHQDGTDAKEDTGSTKASKTQCLDCTHCCASHATLSQNYSAVTPLVTKMLIPSVEGGKARDNFFSLLRPPRTLV